MSFSARSLANVLLARRGYELRRRPAPQPGDWALPAFREQARRVARAHEAQTPESIGALKQKYATPVLGWVEPWTLIERLAECVDPTDVALGCASQQVHVLQVIESMESDGIEDPDMLTAALVHDIGKVLLLTGERPENVVCFNDPVGEYESGIGLDNCVFQWNHDEFAYSRLKDEVPEAVAWTVRYHSVRLAVCERLMDERDRAYAGRYLRPFQKHDQGSKSAFSLPKRPITDYRDLVETALPRKLLF